MCDLTGAPSRAGISDCSRDCSLLVCAAGSLDPLRRLPGETRNESCTARARPAHTPEMRPWSLLLKNQGWWNQPRDQGDGDQQRTTYRFVIGLVMALVMVGAALRIW